MKKGLPEVKFDKHSKLNIEVMDFKQLYQLLNQAQNHSPFEPHKIKFYFILIVTKKPYTHYVDFKSYEIKEGSALFVTKNQIHHFNKDLQKSEGYGLVFNHLFVDEHYFLTDNMRLNRLFNYHIESPVIDSKEIDDDNLTDLISDLHKEYYSDKSFAKTEILAALLRVILLKAERAKELHAITNVNTHWLETFSRFKDLLEADYVNTRNSRVYASKLFVSYKFLNNVVKELTGKTVKTFIDDFVTVEIKRYLISTSLSVNEISYKTGFEEPANMIKFFKRNTATTPFKFRQQI